MGSLSMIIVIPKFAAVFVPVGKGNGDLSVTGYCLKSSNHQKDGEGQQNGPSSRHGEIMTNFLSACESR